MLVKELVNCIDSGEQFELINADSHKPVTRVLVSVGTGNNKNIENYAVLAKYQDWEVQAIYEISLPDDIYDDTAIGIKISLDPKS